ncbi:MAG: hypothetical protein ABIG95_04205 [Candidatus Woesearchaeota archaeon]
MEKGVSTRIIMEVVGKPEEHVKKTLNLLLDQIKQGDGIKLTRSELFDPKPVDNLFSAFMELELEFKDLSLFVSFCLAYMPSSVEIIEPTELLFRSAELSNLLDDLLSRLHQINFVVTNNNAENQILRKNSEGLLKNIVALSLRTPKLIEEISKDVGIKPKELKPFLDRFVKVGNIELVKGVYTLKDMYPNGRQKKS